MQILRKIEHIKAIKFRKRDDDELDVELIKKSGKTLPSLRYGPIYLEGKSQLDIEKGLVLFDDATCTIVSSPFGPIMTCRDDSYPLEL